MSQDEQILGYISKDENVSQRQLSRNTGLSLGQINFILHNLVKKGLIKIEKLNSRRLKYMLTPQGITLHSKRVYSSIRNAVKHVLQLKRELEYIYDEYTSKGWTGGQVDRWTGKAFKSS